MMRDSISGAGYRFRFFKPALASALCLQVAICAVPSARAAMGDTAPGITRSAAESCDRKVKAVQAFAAQPKTTTVKATVFEEGEVNSYLALDLSQKFGPSLRSLRFTFAGANRLQADAVIDFDRLGKNSTKMLALLFGNLFSGTHTLRASGHLIATQGKANFALEEARLDEHPLPGLLVEAIISAVGRKQNPPFDPMQPTNMPYKIEQVEIREGQIVIHQRADISS
jgi:hypothetical protein